MESLTDLRQARFEDVSGSRAGTQQRADREWTAGREEYPAELQLHYQEDFGTTMTDNQYKTLSEDQSKFKESVAGAKTKINDVRAEVQALYTEQNRKLDASLGGLPSSYGGFTESLRSNPEVMYGLNYAAEQSAWTSDSSGGGAYIDEGLRAQSLNNLIDQEYVNHLKSNAGFSEFYNNWAQKNAVKVYIRDPAHPQYNSEYWVMPEAANSIDSIDFQGYGDAYRNSDGSVTVGSDTYAMQIKAQLDEYEVNLYKTLGDAYIPAVQEGAATSRASLNQEYTLANEGLTSQQRIIGEKEEANTSSLNLIRSTYAKKLSNMSESIGSMNYAKSN